MAGILKHNKARRGIAGQGEARPGEARPGEARQGKDSETQQPPQHSIRHAAGWPPVPKIGRWFF